MELHRAFPRAIDFENARRPVPVIGDFRVRQVMRQNDIVFDAEIYRRFEK